MKIISWNVAGFRACLKKGFADFFEFEDADVVCLQEVKVTEEQIPFHPKGYFFYLNKAEKKGYSGTLIYTKKEPVSITYGIGIEEHDHEGRVITIEFPLFFLINVYVPNVKRDLSRLNYRMIWEDDFRTYVKNLEREKSVIICGDFNVAHEEVDIKNSKQNIGNAGFTKQEREKFTIMLNSGLIDTYRKFYPSSETYTWWSYMPGVRERNIGWRIDYFLVSEDIFPFVERAVIYDRILGSDHCPIGIQVKDVNKN